MNKRPTISFIMSRATSVLQAVLWVLLSCANASAQYNTTPNKIWAFGEKAGLSFVSGTPVPILTNPVADEASATVSNNEGQLRFYTNGRKVWDRTHAVMMGGDTICPQETSTVIPLSGIPAGIYWVSILSGENAITRKLAVTK